MNFNELDIFDFFIFTNEKWIAAERIFIKSNLNIFTEIYTDGSTIEWDYQSNKYLDHAVVVKL